MNRDVVGELRGRLGARVIGQIVDGRWHFLIDQKREYLPVLIPRWSITPEYNWDMMTDTRSEQVDLHLDLQIDYHAMKYQFEAMVREISKLLDQKYEEWLKKNHPKFDADYLRGLYSQFGIKNSLFEPTLSSHQQSLFFNPIDRNYWERNYFNRWPADSNNPIGSFGGIKFYESDQVPPGKAYIVENKAMFNYWKDRPRTKFDDDFKELERSIFEGFSRRSLNNNLWGLIPRLHYDAGDVGGGGRHSHYMWQPHENNSNFSMKWDFWRYTGEYQWEWMNRLGKWLNSLRLKR